MTDVDPSAAYRLPYSLRPQRYELHLAPDLEAAAFTGTVRISAEVGEPVDEVVLHAAELSVAAAAVEQDGETLQASVRLDEDEERLVLSLPRPLAPGRCTIAVEFAGVLNDQLHGFYRSTFEDAVSAAPRVLATTQFEATDARRAFPCFDEPDRKAVFSVTIDVPEGLAAFSNGPELTSEPLDGGARRVRFADTISMSTYLVAWVVGPLVASAPREVDGVPLRVVHVPGKEGLCDFALECAAHALTFFAEWFGIPYPAEKLDLLAIPDFAFGAMENLGCVTFRESLLLVDPERASRVELERIADVISHEIAHMWFGDLVTMKWWNGIWLNEAFATFMELLCVDHFRPEWRRWVSFGMERDVAMATDALHATRPVEYPVGPPEEAQGMFDVLTYQKGASVLRMLERYLGAPRFQAGIRRYLADHRLGNTETADLWDALEAESATPVRAVMDSWILQGGLPLVELRGGVVSQSPFALGPPVAGASSAIGTTWQVPVIARSLDENAGHGAEDGHTRLLLGADPVPLAGDGRAASDAPVVLNAGGSGYYRVRYPSDHLRTLAAHLGRLDTLERFNLVSDTWAAVLSGRSQLGDLLELAAALLDSGELDPDVWGQVTSALGLLDHALDGDERGGLGAYVRALLSPVFRRLGWERQASEGERVRTLRAQLVASLGVLGADPDVVAECVHRHDAFVAGDTELDPDLASAVIGVVAASGGEAQFDAFLDHHRHPATPQDEIRYLYALAGFRHDALAARAFELACTEVRTQNAPFLIQLLLANPETGAATWGRLREAWDTVLERTPANITPRMLDGVKALCRHDGLAQQITTFVRAHPLAVGQRSVEQALERLAVNVALARRLAAGESKALTAATARLADR